jgi:lipoic acid synthetase
MTVRHLEAQDWGRLDYRTAYKRQRELVEARIADAVADHLLFVEHSPVITLGRSGDMTDVCVPAETLAQRGIDLHTVDRGGKATYHGPGQLVAYPIVKLPEKDLHRYLQQLLDVIAGVLRRYGLTPELKNGHPGVWVNAAKVASVGIAVRKWVTYHGIALNVATDVEGFCWIIPCGNRDETVTSMQTLLGKPVDMNEVKAAFLGEFRRSFGYCEAGTSNQSPFRHPPWLVRSAPGTAAIDEMEELLHEMRLTTVCQSAHCPNLGECFNRGTATFMILGDRCTRACRFCAVATGKPEPPDNEEARRVAQTAQRLDLNYVVITSVTRDDLADGGAEQFCRALSEVRSLCPQAGIEVLIPDFNGSMRALQNICDARPDMLNHNVETVPRLYPRVRPGADYRRSLAVLEFAFRQGLPVKSGLMLGLGETPEEIMDTLVDLKRTGCRYLTLGQYLAPSKQHLPVVRYVPPQEFADWEKTARRMGFAGVAAGPLVRSSYRAEEMFARIDE